MFADDNIEHGANITLSVSASIAIVRTLRREEIPKWCHYHSGLVPLHPHLYK